MKAKSIFVKIISLLTVIFVTGTVVSAQDVDTSGGGSATITIENASQGKDYTLYKLFSLHCINWSNSSKMFRCKRWYTFKIKLIRSRT